jgi:hypothetical protein
MPSRAPQPQGAACAAPEPAAPALEWRVHLAARQPGRSAGALLAVVLAGVSAFILFQHAASALLAAGLILAAVGEFLFPVTYRLTAEGAEARGPLHWRRIAWTEVKRVYTHEEEVKLSPLAHGGPREPFRGVLLRCNGNRDEVLAAIRTFREAARPPEHPPGQKAVGSKQKAESGRPSIP